MNITLTRTDGQYIVTMTALSVWLQLNLGVIMAEAREYNVCIKQTIWRQDGQSSVLVGVGVGVGVVVVKNKLSTNQFGFPI